MKYLKTFESFKIDHIVELEKGDTIVYKGVQCEVIEPGEFSVKVKSLDDEKEFLINQGQLDQFGIKTL
jgi:hypothetical protein